MLTDLTPASKDTIWQTGLKKEDPTIYFYRRPISLTETSRKYANNWKLKNTLLNDQWVTDEIKEKIKSFLEVNENGNMT
jgi:hypothetical protein